VLPWSERKLIARKERAAPIEKDDEEERRSLAPFSLVSAPFTLD